MEVRRSAIATSVVMALVMALCVGSARAATATTFTLLDLCPGDGSFSNSYVVPNGVTKLRITAVGEARHGGGSENLATHGGGVGGAGEKVTATIAVTPGQTLYLAAIPGGRGDYLDGDRQPQFPNGAGNGGGGVVVSLDNGKSCLLGPGPTQPLVVAGGGGGGGYGDITGPGGAGGSAGANAGSPGNPGDDNGAPAGAGGGGGTQSSGGSGGAAGHEGIYLPPGRPGTAGRSFFAGFGG
jgi:hypothetical protein